MINIKHKFYNLLRVMVAKYDHKNDPNKDKPFMCDRFDTRNRYKIDKVIEHIKEDMPIGTEVIVTGYRRSGLSNGMLKKNIPIGQKLIVKQHTNASATFKPCVDCETYEKNKKCIKYDVVNPKAIGYRYT